MNIRHHLDDFTLSRFASGDLDEAFSVVVSCHLALCANCRALYRAAEEAGGYLLDESVAARSSPADFEKLMHRIGNLDVAEAVKTQASVPPTSSDVPLPLQRFLGTSLDAVKWRTVAPGVRKHAITPTTRTSSSLYMLQIGSGKAMPEHGHGGAEITLILKGAYRDSMGLFGRGDVADLDEHVEHQPIVEPGEPCICLVATERPTKFKGLISRLLQPLVGI